MRLAILAVAAWCVIAAASAAQTSSRRPIAATAIDRAKATYRDHCAVCHGEHANGKGTAAAALTPRPTDLTRLVRRNGTFPAARVEAALKGTDPIVAHGSSGMMIWGAMFLADANGNQAAADAAIGDVVKFVESIQVK